MYSILDKAQSTLKYEIKGTPLILQTVNDGRKLRKSFSIPETKDSDFLVSLSN